MFFFFKLICRYRDEGRKFYPKPFGLHPRVLRLCAGNRSTWKPDGRRCFDSDSQSLYIFPMRARSANNAARVAGARVPVGILKVRYICTLMLSSCWKLCKSHCLQVAGGCSDRRLWPDLRQQTTEPSFWFLFVCCSFVFLKNNKSETFPLKIKIPQGNVRV